MLHGAARGVVGLVVKDARSATCCVRKEVARPNVGLCGPHRGRQGAPGPQPFWNLDQDDQHRPHHLCPGCAAAGLAVGRKLTILNSGMVRGEGFKPSSSRSRTVEGLSRNHGNLAQDDGATYGLVVAFIGCPPGTTNGEPRGNGSGNLKH